jgi:hypothetical protein
MTKKYIRRPRVVRSRTSSGDHRDVTFEWKGESQSVRLSASARSLRWLVWLIVFLLAVTGWPKPIKASFSDLGPSLVQSLPHAIE